MSFFYSSIWWVNQCVFFLTHTHYNAGNLFNDNCTNKEDETAYKKQKEKN